MKSFRKEINILLSLALVSMLGACKGNDESADGSGKDNGSEQAAEVQGTDLREMLRTLSVSENDLGLSGKYTSITEIPDTSTDPDLVGTWKTADGSLTYSYAADGTAKASMEDYGDTENSYTCFVSKDYRIIAEDLEMTDYSSDEKKTVQVVSYNSYKIENDALYIVSVESLEEYTNQSITQLVVLYRADENGDITASFSKNPIAAESFYGVWAYSDNEGETFTIDQNGFTAEGGKTLPVVYKNASCMIIGDKDAATEYSVSLGLEKMYDNSDEKTVTEENYMLGIFYTGKDENDRPNLADIMNDWHSDYGYEQFYFSLNAKQPLK